MTWSAPIERTRSTFAVLHTPVTSAPKALASCTANVPTPPDAPMIRTFCPGWTWPVSRSACRAVGAEMGTAAACSKVRFAGLGASLSSRARAYSAKAPSPDAEHLVARLEPGHVLADRLDAPGDIRAADTGSWACGARNPRARTRYGRPVMRCQTPRSTPAACTRTSTSSSPTTGLSMSLSSGRRPSRTCPGRSPSCNFPYLPRKPLASLLSDRTDRELVIDHGSRAA